MESLDVFSSPTMGNKKLNTKNQTEENSKANILVDENHSKVEPVDQNSLELDIQDKKLDKIEENESAEENYNILPKHESSLEISTKCSDHSTYKTSNENITLNEYHDEDEKFPQNSSKNIDQEHASQKQVQSKEHKTNKLAEAFCAFGLNLEDDSADSRNIQMTHCYPIKGLSRLRIDKMSLRTVNKKF
ncbi:MAG: hypothetical protein MHPSP_002543 [Paramarteilia canceri]